MKTKFLQTLKTKYEGVSETILSRIASKVAETATDESAIEEITLQDILERYGDSRATEAAVTAVAKYKKEVGATGESNESKKKDPKDDQEKEPQKKGATQDDVLIKRIEELEKLIRLQHSQTRIGKVKDLIGDLPETLQKPYLRINVESLSEDEFGSLYAEITEDVKSIKEDLKTKESVKKTVFGFPPQKGGESEEDVPESVKKEIEKGDDKGQPF